MSEYTTETGYFVLVDSQGRVFGRASVPTGTHTVSDRADPAECYDVESAEDLATVSRNEFYNDRDNW